MRAYHLAVKGVVTAGTLATLAGAAPLTERHVDLTGYFPNGQSHFGRLFKARFSTTPREYRQRAMNR